jgi:hypothetical protein
MVCHVPRQKRVGTESNKNSINIECLIGSQQVTNYNCVEAENKGRKMNFKLRSELDASPLRPDARVLVEIIPTRARRGLSHRSLTC